MRSFCLLLAMVFTCCAYTDTVIDNSVKGSEIKPYWRKGDGPTVYPSWFNLKGVVTHEVFYDAGKTSLQNGAALELILENLAAGDYVLIHAGTYSINNKLIIDAVGTASSPVYIVGASGETVVITRPNASQNCINVDNSSYVVMEGLEISGGSNSVKFYNADHWMIYNCKIHDAGDAAITANINDTSYLYCIDNEIYALSGTGEGLYIGGNSGSVKNHHSYFCGNYIHDLIGGGITQGDGIEIKDGSYANTVKYNYIANTNYPGVTIYGTQKGATDRNLVAENVIINANDYALQISGEVVVRNNLIINNNYRAVYSKSIQNAVPGYIDFCNNTVLSSERAFNVSNWSGRPAIIVANNFFYSSTSDYLGGSTGSAILSNNVQKNALTALINLSVNGVSKNLRPHPSNGADLINTASATYLPEVDIMGYSRTLKNDVGAQNSWINVVAETDPFGVNEGSSGSFKLKLSHQPVATFVVKAAITSGDEDLQVHGISTISFSTSNWNTYNSFQISAANDSDSLNGSAVLQLSKSSGTDILNNLDVMVKEVDTGSAQSYTISVTSGSNGSISPSTSQTVVAGGSTTFVITPNANYVISELKIDGTVQSAVATYTFENVQANHSLETKFALKTYLIAATTGANGAISSSGNSTVAHGANKTYTITPNIGYEVQDVLIDGVSVGAVSAYTFSNVVMAHTISVSFKTIAPATYTIVASDSAGGSISPSGNVIVTSGQSQTFTISKNSGYNIKEVLVDGVSVGSLSTYTFSNVTIAHTISVQFALKTYIVSASSTVGGSVSPSGSTSIMHGSTLQFSFTPNSGYEIENILVDGSSRGVVSTLDLKNITKDMNVVAKFKLKAYSITASAGSGGAISPSGSVPVTSGGSKTFTITPNNGYLVKDVLVNGVSKGNVKTYTLSNVLSNQTVYVTFEKAAVLYVVASSYGSNGKVVPEGNVFVAEHNNLSFEIVPDNGYEVDYLEVDGVTVLAKSSFEFTDVIKNHNIKAYFKFGSQNHLINVKTNSVNGHIVPAGNIVVVPGQSQTFSFLPLAGYQVGQVKVDGVVQGPMMEYKFDKVETNHELEVSFIPIEDVFVIQAEKNGSGVISPTGNVVVTKGTNRTFTFMPDAGFRIESIEVDGKILPASSSYTFNGVESPHRLQVTFSEIPISFDFAITHSAGGSVSPKGTVKIEKNENVSLSLVADSGYVLTELLVDGVAVFPVLTYTFLDVQSAHSFHAIFSKVEQTVSLSASASVGGGISPNGLLSIEKGSSQTFAITPQSNYEVSDVVVDGVSMGALSSYTFYNLEVNHTIAVSFTLSQNVFALNISGSTGGLIQPANSISIAEGRSQTFEFIATTGYEVKDILVDGVSVGSGSSYTFVNVLEDHALEVVFGVLNKSSEKKITTFHVIYNSRLYQGIVDGYQINIDLPEDANLSELVVGFDFIGQKVVLENKTFVSGISVNDYNHEVVLTVYADDGSYEYYYVNVKKSKDATGTSVSETDNSQGASSNAIGEGGGGCDYNANGHGGSTYLFFLLFFIRYLMKRRKISISFFS